LLAESPWRESNRGDPLSVDIADRHYNRQKIGTPQFVPPGRCLVYRTKDDKALWTTSWPFAEFTKHAWAGAWVNSLFRNEGAGLSSELILWAVAHTRATWEPPELGMITFVDASKVKQKKNPGYCYLMAGFHEVGKTKGGLLAFQLLPDEMPEACPVPRDQLSFDL
jgi:hypothetical protein